MPGSGWCSGYSSRLAPMHPGFKSRSGCMCKWLSQSMLALAGFLRVLRFPPAFKIGTCLAQSITPPHPGGMGSCRVKKWILQSSADRQSRFHGSTPKWSNMILMIHQWWYYSSLSLISVWKRRYINPIIIIIIIIMPNKTACPYNIS